MAQIFAFQEAASANTVNISATTSTANVALGTADMNSARWRTVRVVNPSSSIIFIDFGVDNTITASATNCMPIAPGATEVFRISYNVTHVAAITGTGSANQPIYFTNGAGT